MIMGIVLAIITLFTGAVIYVLWSIERFKSTERTEAEALPLYRIVPCHSWQWSLEEKRISWLRSCTLCRYDQIGVYKTKREAEMDMEHLNND